VLILPIYHNRALAGVLEVFFSEAHAFQDREICTYQLMARVVGEAMAHAVLLEQKKVLVAERSSMPQAVEQIENQLQRFPGDSGSPANTHAVPLAPAENMGRSRAGSHCLGGC
jgi:GAF domain-containing protein